MSTTNPYAPPQGAVFDVARGDAMELADPLLRLGAFVADCVVAFVMICLPALIFVLATQGIDGSSLSVVVDDGSTAGLLVFIGLAAWLWITALLVARNGQTIGKRLLEIKVVRADGSPASLGRIFWLRNFVNTFLGVIPLYWLVDVLFVFGPRRRCLHDLIADTIVVKV